MGRLFDYDNALMRFLNKMTDVIYLSILWAVCSIPIITIGASTTALYYAYTKSVRNDRGYAWKEFFSSFKSNFKQSTIIWLIALGLYVVCGVDLLLVNQLVTVHSFAKVVRVCLIAFLFMETMWFVFLFPYVARFENTTKQIMKNCALISIIHFLRTILLAVILVVSIVVALFIPLALFFVPGFYMLIANRILEPIFRKYMSPEDLKAENERNGIYEDEIEDEDTEEVLEY